MPQTSPNPFADRARAAKVAKLLAVVPHGRTAVEIAKIADWLEKTDAKVRQGIAMQAGVRWPASDETWSQLVGAARSRTPLDELDAEAQRILGVAS